MDITEDDMPYDFYDEFDEDMYVQEEEEPEEIIISSEMNFRHLKISITANSEVSELLPDEPLIKILNSLTEKEKQVLIYRFGLSDKRSRTLEETGRELNVTGERIRQIEVKALRKIKQKLSIWDKLKYDLNDDDTIALSRWYLLKDAQEIVIPEEIDGHTVTVIKSEAFCGCCCKDAETITIPNTIRIIEKKGLDGLCSLEKINIHDSVEIIGREAFGYNKKATNINIPASVRSIGEGVFSSFIKLEWVVVDACNEYYDTLNGVLYDRREKKLIAYLNGIERDRYIIPEGIVIIGKEAFQHCPNLKSIKVSQTVTTIEKKAFYRCKKLETIDIPASVTTIGKHAFENCPKLELIVDRDSYAAQYARENGYSYNYRIKADKAIEERLIQIKYLLDKGLITEEECSKKRCEILAEI